MRTILAVVGAVALLCGTSRAYAVTAEEAKVAKAEEKAQTAENEKDEQSDLRSGKLLEYGITGGVAVGVHIPMPRFDGGTGIEEASIATVPYLMIAPFYLLGRDEVTAAYCSRQWLGNDHSDATEAAMVRARKYADWQLRAFTSDLDAEDVKRKLTTTASIAKYRANLCTKPSTTKAVKAPATPEGAPTWKDRCEAINLWKVQAQQIFDWYMKPNVTPDERTVWDAGRLTQVEALAHAKWNVTLRGKCAAQKFGLWVGRPINYTVEVLLAEPNPPVDGDREVTAHVAFGAAFIPNAYFSALLGATYGTVDVGTRSEAVWAITTGIGGNVDLVKAFLP